VSVTRPGMFNHDGVGTIGIQGAIDFVNQGNRRKDPSAFKPDASWKGYGLFLHNTNGHDHPELTKGPCWNEEQGP